MAVDKSDVDDVDASGWKKISKTAVNVGYKEGIDHAKDQILQEGFDSGYLRGLDIGIKLGFYNAVSSSSLSNKMQTDLPSQMLDKLTDENIADLLKKPSMGQCQMCSNKKILEYPMAGTLQIQENHNKTITTMLNENFSDILNHLGIEENIIK